MWSAAMENISNDRPGINPAATRASIDTIELFVRRVPRGFPAQMGKLFGKRIEVKEVRDRTGHFRGLRIPINRPRSRDIPILARIARDRALGCCVSRVDIAVDIHTESAEEAAELIAQLDRHLVLKWRGRGATKVRIGETVYWADRRRARNLVVYPKGSQIVRTELRFQGARAVRRAGLDRLEDLENLDVQKLITHNIKAERPTERSTERAARKTFQEELRRNRTTRAHPVTDTYRSRIPNRVRSILSKADAQSRKGSGAERLSMELLHIRDRITPRGKNRGH